MWCAPKPPSAQPWRSALLTNCQRNSLRPSRRYDLISTIFPLCQLTAVPRSIPVSGHDEFRTQAVPGPALARCAANGGQLLIISRHT